MPLGSICWSVRKQVQRVMYSRQHGFGLNVDDCRKAIEQSPKPIHDCRAIAGQHVKNITNNADFIDDDPHWSADGTKIVYARHNVADDGGTVVGVNNYTTAEIFVMRVNPDGTPVDAAN